MNVQIYVEQSNGIYNRLDMFDDENISIKFKLKDSSDLSKIYSTFDDSSIVAGKYNRFEQMAVVVKDSDFVRKTKINDKNKISYNFVFELATNKIR